MSENIQMEELVRYKRRWFTEKLEPHARWNLRDACHLLLTNGEYILVATNGQIGDEYVQEVVKGIVGIGEEIYEAYGEAYATPAAFLRWVESCEYAQRVPDNIKQSIQAIPENHTAAEDVYTIHIDTARKRCEISCQGERHYLRLKLGHRYLACLIQCPGRMVEARELYRAVKECRPPAGYLENKSQSGKAEQLGHELRQLLADRETATIPMEKEEIQARIDKKIQELQKETRKPSKKKVNKDAQKVRNSIGKNINQAIREIEEHSSVLGEHLRHSIKNHYSACMGYFPSNSLEIVVFH